MLVAERLVKRYPGGRAALDGCDFTVADGELVALLGANGAGKSTTMRCFLDFTRPDAGRALVDGIDVARAPLEAKRRLAFVPETVVLHEALSGRQNVDFFAGLGRGAGERRADARALLAAAGLAVEAHDRRVGGYSKGMRQKVGLAIAAARGAANLLLDEPTSGLDPRAAAELTATLGAWRDRGAAILMATHDVFRARDCADRILVLRAGRITAEYARAEFAGADVERLYLDAIAGDDAPALARA